MQSLQFTLKSWDLGFVSFPVTSPPWLCQLGVIHGITGWRIGFSWEWEGASRAGTEEFGKRHSLPRGQQLHCLWHSKSKYSPSVLQKNPSPCPGKGVKAGYGGVRPALNPSFEVFWQISCALTQHQIIPNNLSPPFVAAASGKASAA